MIIDDLEFYLVEIERTDGGLPDRSLLVRLESDDGREGWGEASWASSDLPPRRHAVLSTLHGRSIFDVEELLTLDLPRSPGLMSAIEMACWDLVGRTLKQPLCRLWGGEYRPAAPIAVRLPPAPPPRVAEVAWAMAEQGFLTQMITGSGDVDQDFQSLSEVRSRVGTNVRLRFDGRSSYGLEAARDLCAQMEYDAPQFFLDPLAGRDFFALAGLGRQTSVPLAIGAAVASPADVFAAVRCGAAPYVVIDFGRVGGLTRARQCAAVAEAGGATALIGGGASFGVAAAAMLQVVASTPAFATCNECDYHQIKDDVLARPLLLAEGMLAVPRGPGLGVEVDREKVERYQVG